MTGKPECFLIYVTIIEGRHFDILNMDSVVQLRIEKQRKCTGVQLSTDSPYFNEYFVFEFNTHLNKLLDQQLVLTVIQPRKKWKRRKVLGYFKLDISTIWTAPDQRFYHKWVILTGDLNDKKPGAKGYLKIDVGILSKGETATVPKTSVLSHSDDIEGNLLMHEYSTGIYERTRANFIFNIYNANLKIKHSVSCAYVEISFAGLSAKTSTQQCNENIVWNEQIIFNELFPTLSQRIKIELKYIHGTPPTVNYIFLKNISDDGENGFLPTFGPSYIYFYNNDGLDINYHGKLLLEIKTELLNDLMWSSNSTVISPVLNIPDLSLWDIEKYLLFCNIYSATMIHKKLKGKSISFEITMGDIDSKNASSGRKLISDNQRLYSYLSLNNQVICLSQILDLIGCRRTLYNTNMLKKIYNLLKQDLDKVSELFEDSNKKSKTKINSSYLTIAEKLEKNCRIFLNIVKRCPTPRIELQAKQLELCIKDIKDIEENIVKIVHMSSRSKIYKILLNVLCKLHCLIENVLDCWPNIILWMLADKTKVGYFKISPSKILFSLTPEEKGVSCGALEYIFITDVLKSNENSSNVLARIGVQIWLGLYEYTDHCMQAVDDCFEPITLKETNDIPRIFLCTSTTYATYKIYIYQARIETGADQTALSDPFVQVIVNEHVLKTKSISKTLCPVWDTTLIFQNIKLNGSTEFLSVNIPPIVLEIYDQDILSLKEFIGRSVLTPELYYNYENVSSLRWIKIINRNKSTGEILISGDLILQNPIEEEEELIPDYSIIESIPSNIKPNLIKYRMDVYFWGVHDLKKVYLRTILKPKITISCGDNTLHSTTLKNTKKNINFIKPYQYIYMNIPDNPQFYPPLSISMHDCRGFGHYIYIGTNLSKVENFIYKPISQYDRQKSISEINYSEISPSLETLDSEEELIKRNKFCNIEFFKFKFFSKIRKKCKRKTNSRDFEYSIKHDKIDFDVIDWWTKYYISAEKSEYSSEERIKQFLRIMVYPCELEKIEDFHSFNDLLHTFKLYRGKNTGDEILDDDYVIGTFKGNIRIWQCPEDNHQYVTETGHPVEEGTFQHYPLNESVDFVVRVYVVRAYNLRPKDASGKSDPYVVVNLGEKQIIDKDNYVPNEVNPIFGRCYELKGTFPQNNMLTVCLWDWDLSSADDIIGETKIDLENRFYTNHRANCGLPIMYIPHGPCAWRDQSKPSQILHTLCQVNHLGEPEYSENSVRVGSNIFTNYDLPLANNEVKVEALSLYVLNKWRHVSLVGCRLLPEHVETRSLYNYAKPGIEQGKLQMWVDIFPIGDFPLPAPVDIKPRVPLMYELRVIIWNVDQVTLEEDDFFVGEKKSDIYVKGWLTTRDESQCTDVHYNSISGEGNFNWRFIFRFLYLPTEDKVVIKQKKSIFSVDITERKIPCYLYLQVWDNDTFNPDDFLGSLKISLSKLPRGAKSSKLCTLNNLTRDAPTINLFKTKRHKGWWPFIGETDENLDLAGKVEAEFELLNEEESKNSPAGLGRSEPQQLPPPNRPDISFFWLQSPLKSLKYLVCKRFRSKIILSCIFGLLIFMVLVAIYSFPNYAVKKLLHV